MPRKRIILAGGTGDPGLRIAKSLLRKGAEMRILTRSNGSSDKLGSLIKSGARASILQPSNM